jgi:nitroreductase
MNQTIELMNARTSTRAYDPAPPSGDEKQAILHTAMRAPTAGNLMLYTIIEIEDQTLKDRLAVTCDHQPFIAKAPWVLVFAADFQKWIDLFAVSGVERVPGVRQRGAPGVGDLLMACSDALIAAQNAVIAAQSLGIGSCYIGDVLEQAEEVAELLGLPAHTLPAAMLCFGRPAKPRRLVPHYEKHMVHRNRYRRLDAEGLREASDELAQQHAPRGFRDGIENIGQDVYARKYAADFSHEMNRSAAVWLTRWQTPEG